MTNMKYQSNFLLVAYILLTTLLTRRCSLAKPVAQPQPLPFYTSLDDRREDTSYYAPPPYDEPISDYRLSRLRRGFYYVDDGYITAVPASAVAAPSTAIARRQDESAIYAPVLSYRQQQTKHKKLFVPNLYG